VGLVSRGTQALADLATDRRAPKRGGSGPEGLPSRAGADHEEAEAQEGQVGRRPLIVLRRRGSTLTMIKALKTENGTACQS